MTAKDMEQLGRNAADFAKTYVRLKEALMAEGVTEEEARAEASHAAHMAASMRDEDTDERCPLCGK